jgi:phospholipid/cholesterol/gamma-HCH transport system substrate-binding protein
MSKARLELKVGLFVLLGLALLGGLALEFSKGTGSLRPHYDIQLHAAAVNGLKVQSQVLMAGFPVGSISAINLSKNGKEALITLRISKKFEIYDDARFVIETSGLLGDQYVAIVPTENKGVKYPEGKPPKAEEPFNYSELARAVTGFVPKVNEAATNLNGAIADIRRELLTEQTLTNLAAAMQNLRTVSENASMAIDKISALVATNEPAISQSGSNLLAFTEQLQGVADQLKGMVATNTPPITTAIKNIESSTEVLKSLMDDVQAGKGLAGNLVKNEQLATNVAQIAYNLSITTSNLNRLGLWGILWKKKAPPAPKPQASPAAPKSTH